MTRYNTITAYPTLNKEQIKTLIQQKKDQIDLISKIVPYNNDSEWSVRCANSSWWSKEYNGETPKNIDNRLLRLRDTLLSMAGCEVVLPIADEDIADITQYGQLWTNITTKMMKGRPSKCHANAAELWYENKETYKDGHAIIICTGYALSKDGFWRQHSWLIHAKARANNVIETTEPRLAYFGFGMTYEQAERFEYYNS